jgi:hypothetical protein
VKRKRSVTPEPGDKLGATAQVVVSGPKDAMLDWRQIDWRQIEENVRRLRQRIFTASKAGDLQKVRRLQKLMLRSRSNTLLSVRRVTERNAGRLTAGVDGEVALTDETKAELVWRVHDPADVFKAMPVRRVFIPKPGGKRRPLGIPVEALRRPYQLSTSSASVFGSTDTCSGSRCTLRRCLLPSTGLDRLVVGLSLLVNATWMAGVFRRPRGFRPTDLSRTPRSVRVFSRLAAVE